MKYTIPLYEYLRKKVEHELPSIPTRAIPDLIAWALEFKSYTSATQAHSNKKVDLNDPEAVQKLLCKWKEGEPKSTIPDTALLENLCSKNKSSALIELDIETLMLCLNTALIFYRPEVLHCDSCKKEMNTMVDDIEFISHAENEFDIYASLCPDCLNNELTKKRSERTIYSVDGSYRYV